MRRKLLPLARPARRAGYPAMRGSRSSSDARNTLPARRTALLWPHVAPVRTRGRCFEHGGVDDAPDFPLPAEPVDLLELYGRPPSGVRLSMISSVDGAASFGGRSGTLGGKADTELLGLLRSVADVVLVAAGTVRAEHYGPAAVPIAVISRTCQLDFAAPLFTAATARSLVLTVSTAPAEARARAAQVADLIVTGEHDLDLAAALRALAKRGCVPCSRRWPDPEWPSRRSRVDRRAVPDGVAPPGRRGTYAHRRRTRPAHTVSVAPADRLRGRGVPIPALRRRTARSRHRAAATMMPQLAGSPTRLLGVTPPRPLRMH